METTNKISKFRNSVSMKLALIALLSLLLLIPTVFIRKLIDERQTRRNETILEVTSKWGQSQTLFAPVIIIPCEKYEKTSSNTFITRKNYMHILPDEVEITGSISPEIRRRGIYKVILYSADLSLNAIFTKESFSDWPDTPDRILWSDAVLVAGITDLKGLNRINKMEWNNKSVSAEGGIPFVSDITTGFHAPVSINTGEDNDLQLQIILNGSESLYFIPSGKSTKVNLSSNWTTPSFDGSTLPDRHEVTDKGFAAEWNVLHITRPFPQKWSNNAYSYQIAESGFGVNLYIPVDIYQKTTRSVKYALLFIGLTFLVIFFIEVVSKKRIHVVQYLLTGAALVIFYSLLLSLSEHLPFGWAYLIASVGIIGLIASYIQALFNKRSYTFTALGILAALYGFLFAILHMSDLALLLGNIGLFIILALVMFFSRKIDWYNERNTSTTNSN